MQSEKVHSSRRSVFHMLINNHREAAQNQSYSCKGTCCEIQLIAVEFISPSPSRGGDRGEGVHKKKITEQGRRLALLKPRVRYFAQLFHMFRIYKQAQRVNPQMRINSRLGHPIRKAFTARISRFTTVIFSCSLTREISRCAIDFYKRGLS